MLETLISSRIRRTLLEHLLAHPEQRGYLRGLAKELNLPVSPLRRELKRLEALGLLKASQEANILFYHVDRTCPLFLQLTSALRSPSAAIEPIRDTNQDRGHKTRSQKWFVSPKLAMEGVALSLMVAGVLAGVAYLAYTNQRLLLVTKHAVLTPKTQVTVVESPTATTASGTMRGTRWQLIPGGQSY
ncbi:MAG: winged helix-turn-helix transcriptional regulator [Candidatus Omnitrophica bacterium]|nr:winged helix-turn-helix transcriptional regulator [Candidatus Omnitrophota bacterium]